MKHYVFILAMLLTSLVAFADNDVGKYETLDYTLPSVTDIGYVYAPAMVVFTFHSYDCQNAVCAEDMSVPAPSYSPVTKGLRRYYSFAERCFSSVGIVRWRHRQHGEYNMNLRYTKFTYKR